MGLLNRETATKGLMEVVPVRLPRPRDFSAMRVAEFHAACDRVRQLMNAAGFTE